MIILNYTFILFFICVEFGTSFDIAKAAESTTKVPSGSNYVFNSILVDPTATDDPAGYEVRPFYISIFEASCRDKRAVLGEGTSCFNQYPPELASFISSDWKSFPDEKVDLDYPAYFGVENRKPLEAIEFCRLQGGRLPTPIEWTLAALNIHENKNATHYSDRLFDFRGVPTSNIGGRVNRPSNDDNYKYFIPAPAVVTDFKALGIDISGTVGMTGNFPELAINPEATQNQNSSSPMFSCGFSYDADHAQITQALQIGGLCQDAWGRPQGVRCVFDYSSEETIQVFDTTKVKGHLRDYIEKRQSRLKEKILKGENNGSVVGFFPGLFVDLRGSSQPQKLELPRLSHSPELASEFVKKVLNYQHSSPTPSQQTQDDAEAFTIKSDGSSSDTIVPPRERLIEPPGYRK
ncbi:MAG: SUMF1/EgtB/PvdO family nonheme iron enzyme [Bdellovibrionales bacterium]|nr:SUMF1/EgtB/PvdO family nonheme iron enzyme [Bdellovibrionales bacterium]